MKKLENFKKVELESLDQIQGGKKIPSYDLFGKQTDIRKYKGNGQLKWVKTLA